MRRRGSPLKRGNCVMDVSYHMSLIRIQFRDACRKDFLRLIGKSRRPFRGNDNPSGAHQRIQRRIRGRACAQQLGNGDRMFSFQQGLQDAGLLWGPFHQCGKILRGWGKCDAGHTDHFCGNFFAPEHGGEKRPHHGREWRAVILRHPVCELHHHRGKRDLPSDNSRDRPDPGNIRGFQQLEDRTHSPALANHDDHTSTDHNMPPELLGNGVVEFTPLGPVDQDAGEGGHGGKDETGNRKSEEFSAPLLTSVGHGQYSATPEGKAPKEQCPSKVIPSGREVQNA